MLHTGRVPADLSFIEILCEKIKYDDGDVEVLCLDKERWELIESARKMTKVWIINYLWVLFESCWYLILIFVF